MLYVGISYTRSTSMVAGYRSQIFFVCFFGLIFRVFWLFFFQIFVANICNSEFLACFDESQASCYFTRSMFSPKKMAGAGGSGLLCVGPVLVPCSAIPRSLVRSLLDPGGRCIWKSSSRWSVCGPGLDRGNK